LHWKNCVNARSLDMQTQFNVSSKHSLLEPTITISKWMEMQNYVDKKVLLYIYFFFFF